MLVVIIGGFSSGSDGGAEERRYVTILGRLVISAIFLCDFIIASDLKEDDGQ
jgi:hypothetical protein